MTREQAKQLVKLRHVIEAFADGDDIQWLNSNGNWEDFKEYHEFTVAHNWRLKPKPNLRPWTLKEFPMGCWLSNEVALSSSSMFACIEVRKEGVFIRGRQTHISFEELQAYWKHSTDNGKTWHPCGVLE